MQPYDENEDELTGLGPIPPELMAIVAKEAKDRQAAQDASDASTLEQLKGLDATSKDNARASLITQGFGNATAHFLGQPGQRLQVPKVDENVRAFLLQKAQRKPPGMLSDLARVASTIRALREPPVRPSKPGEEPPDDALIAAAKTYKIDPAPYRTRQELLTALNAAMQSGRSAENQAVAATKAEEAKTRQEERKAETAAKREGAKAVGDLDSDVEEADAIIAEVKKNPKAFYATAKIGDYLGEGTLGKVVNRVQATNRDPNDTATRAIVLQRAYQLKNKLAGAAVSKQEQAAIEEFNPSENDTAEQIIAKIEGMKRLAQIKREAKAKQHGVAPAPAAPVPDAPVRPGDKYLRK